VTAYGEDGLRCAACLGASGATKGAEVARQTGVARATRLMADNHYGWFERVSTGIYTLTPQGAEGLETWSEAAPNPGDRTG